MNNPAPMHWTQTADAIPDDNETVLIFVDGEPWTGYHEAGAWHYVCGEKLGGRVTHWMPFPAAPEQVAA